MLCVFVYHSCNIIEQYPSSKLLLWWTAEDYKTVLKWKKRVNLAFRINAVLFLSGFLIYCARHPFNKPLPNMLQDIGVCLTGLTGCCGTFVFASNRKRISKMLKAVRIRTFWNDVVQIGWKIGDRATVYFWALQSLW